MKREKRRGGKGEGVGGEGDGRWEGIGGWVGGESWMERMFWRKIKLRHVWEIG